MKTLKTLITTFLMIAWCPDTFSQLSISYDNSGVNGKVTRGGATANSMVTFLGTNETMTVNQALSYLIVQTADTYITITNTPTDTGLQKTIRFAISGSGSNDVIWAGQNLSTPGGINRFRVPAGMHFGWIDSFATINTITMDWLGTTNTDSGGVPVPGSWVNTTNGGPVLATGTSGQVLTVGANGVPAFAAATGGSASTNQAQTIFKDDEFLGGSVGNTQPAQGFGMVFTANSGASQTTTAGETNHPGLIQASTSTSSTAAPVFLGGSFAFGSEAYTLRWLIKTPTTLSDGTDTYRLVIGFGDQNNGSLPTDGAYFFYNHLTNANWNGFTVNNTAINVASGGSTVAVAAATWYDLVVVVNAAASSASFYVNGTLIGTSGSNIPSGTTRATNLQFQIAKEVGTNTRILIGDYVSVSSTLANPRW